MIPIPAEDDHVEFGLAIWPAFRAIGAGVLLVALIKTTIDGWSSMSVSDIAMKLLIACGVSGISAIAYAVTSSVGINNQTIRHRSGIGGTTDIPWEGITTTRRVRFLGMRFVLIERVDVRRSYWLPLDVSREAEFVRCVRALRGSENPLGL